MSASTLLPMLDEIRPPDGSADAPSAGDAGRQELAERLVRWSLDEYRHIRGFDTVSPHPRDPVGRRNFDLIRQAYSRWAADADVVLDRVAAAKGGRSVPGWAELRDAVGRT